MHSVNVNGREVPVVSPRLSLSDRVGGWKMRWNLGRDRYTVAPGLYAVGAPSLESPVLVTANYKLTFDKVRAECQGLDAWILVLDTRGVNVWCAAGKGTFSTRELEQRLLAVRLDQVVSHRTLILPQLGATGVFRSERAERYRLADHLRSRARQGHPGFPCQRHEKGQRHEEGRVRPA